IRAGIGAVALDLPGHGERFVEGSHSPRNTPTVVEQMYEEIDGVLASIRERYPRLDMGRAAIGGMSAGGMAALRRLCEPHPFRAAAIEGTTGDLLGLYLPNDGEQGEHGAAVHDRSSVERVDTLTHLDGFDPLPLLALHIEGDQLVPFGVQRGFLDRLADHYEAGGASRDLIQLETYRDTGAPHEHAGFGKFGSDAKNTQLEFLTRVLLDERA
ncbi:MAG: prolyl oligopeptidase family serine peptidase, partial [Planctomycetota bacterium]